MTTAPPPNTPAAKPKSSSSDDKAFLAGIQCWLFFLLMSVGLAYPLPLAIILGAVGGVAGASIVGAWVWEPKKNTPEEREEAKKWEAQVDADYLAKGLDVNLYELVRAKREHRYTEGRKRRQSMSIQDWFKTQKR